MAPGENGAERLPLWSIEGMAEYLSIGPVDPNSAMWLRDVARQEKLPAVKDLDNPKYFPYRWDQAFWAYVGGRWGDEVIGSMLTTASAAGDVEAAFEKVLGVKAKELSSDWQASIPRPRGHGQLRHAQGAQSRAVVCSTSALSSAFHPDERQVAQSS